MDIALPPLLKTYFETANSDDQEAQLACFAPDAVVKDESQPRNGRDQIREWIRWAAEQYDPRYEILEVEECDGRTTVTCRVSGTFDGSPVDIRFIFLIKDGLIAELETD